MAKFQSIACGIKKTNPSYVHLISRYMTLCSRISYLIFFPPSVVLFITLSCSLSLFFMPSISQYSLIFPCYYIALSTLSHSLCYSFMEFLPHCLSLSPSFSLCTSLLIYDILLLFQPLSFALNCFTFFIYWLRLN